MFTYFFERDFSDTISRLFLFALIAMLPFMGGCGEDDNPIVDDHDHEHDTDAPLHADVDGFILEVEEKEVYRQFKGNHTGGLTVNVGEEIEVHVVFLDENEDEAHLHEVEAVDEHGHEEEFALGFSEYDSAIIEIHLHHDDQDDQDDQDDHDDHGDELPFGLVGLKAGKTEIKLQLLHGDHPDFTAALRIPVTVQ